MTEHTDEQSDGYSKGHDGTQPPVPPVVPPGPPVGPVSVSGADYAAPAPFYGPVAPRTNTLSIVSLVTGFFFGLAAVITGHIALSQIKRNGEAGKGMAIAGLVLGYVGIAATTAGVVLAVVFAATFGVFINSIAGDVQPAAPVAGTSGQVGAAYLDEGYLQAGGGDIVVDLYIDPMCPYCGQFEAINGVSLAALVDDGTIALRVHSLTFLDPMSQGSEYSTRASNALTCEAAINPDSTLDYMAALFAHQPAEGTSGLTDEELVELSDGSAPIADCVESGRYAEWSQQNTEVALHGPIPGAEISSIEGTPTVLVDGTQYMGSINDPHALTEFILG